MPYSNREKQKKYQQEYYEDRKALWRERNLKRRKERKVWFLEVTKGIKCLLCGEKERCCLVFHHKDTKSKDGNVSKLLTDLRSKEKILKEISKCVVLCANCHRKLHWKQKNKIP